MKTIKYLFLLLLFNGFHPAVAQTVSNIPAGTTDNSSIFQYEVKLIEEFIERFNDNSSSYIRQQCRSMFGTDSMITRNKVLKSLVNKIDCRGDTAQFFRQVADPAHPHFLSFTDSTWYAETQCTFLYNKKLVKIPITLHMKTVNGGSEWMIAGIGKSDIFNSKIAVPPIPVTKGSRTPDYIPTSSYGTNFVVFSYVLSSKMVPSDYFDGPLLATPRAQQFIALIKQHKLTFKYAKNIKYHFYQVDQWVFTVEQFKRKDTNSGWLISNLQKVTPGEKLAMLNKLLYP
jgi:hypothetical protein